MHDEGGGALYSVAPPPSPPGVFVPKICRHPIPKILDFSRLFVADAPAKTKFKKHSFIPYQSTFGTPSTVSVLLIAILGSPFLAFKNGGLHVFPSFL